MEQIMNDVSMRGILNSSAQLYIMARNLIGIPIDAQNLSDLIKRIKIDFVKNENTTGTFKVNTANETLGIVTNNFANNQLKTGIERNLFLLLHEMTHLSSNVSRCISGRKDLRITLGKYESIKQNKDLSGIDVTMGLYAVDEVLAQWVCERCNKALKRECEEIKIKSEIHDILGTKVIAETSFSEHDIYAPLEQYVVALAQRLGYNDFKLFVTDMLLGRKELVDLVNNENAEQFGYLGILCEGIYQSNGFNDFGLPETDIPKAVAYLEEQKEKLRSNNKKTAEGFQDAEDR